MVRPERSILSAPDNDRGSARILLGRTLTAQPRTRACFMSSASLVSLFLCRVGATGPLAVPPPRTCTA